MQAAPSTLAGPVSQTIVAGTSVTFSASASGYPVPTVQWQQSTNGTNYTNIAGATSSTYTISAATASQNAPPLSRRFHQSGRLSDNGRRDAHGAIRSDGHREPQQPDGQRRAIGNVHGRGHGQSHADCSVAGEHANNGASFSNIAGATTATLRFSSVTSSQNGYQYRAVFTNSIGSATTATATLTVQFAPQVTTNPTSKTVAAGQSATFTAAASGNTRPTVQWQVSTDGGATYSNIAGATSTSLAVNGTTAGQNGDKYRAVFTNGLGSSTTTAATLTIQVAPAITTNPTSQSVAAGQSVTFTAAATGNPAPTVQWQVSTDGGATYSNIAGATSTTLTLTSTTSSQNGYKYRAVFTNSIGSRTTIVATLTVL